ncbi:hypothetical protein ES707_10343 [subsurface metagenome]
MIMIDTLGIDWNLVIVIAVLWGIWVYPAIFVHLYAERKLDEAKRREAHEHRDIEQNLTAVQRQL